jgi:biotin carboxyl carrier protein
MTCNLDTRSGQRTIEFRRRGSEWEMTLDGRILSVDVTAIAGRWSLLIGPPVPPASAGHAPAPPASAGHAPVPPASAGQAPAPPASVGRPKRSYEVAVERRSNGERIVHVNGAAVTVSIIDPRAQLARRRGTVSAETGPRPIVSPMPGRIVKVLVQSGDTVAAHQGLVVVEAMKMENELRAPRAGQVTAVNVVEGMSVEGGAVLIVME